METPKFELEEVGTPINFRWDKCKLETVSFGHGIATTPLQAATAYAAMTNGGNLVQPSLKLNKSEKTNALVSSVFLLATSFIKAFSVSVFACFPLILL